MNGNDMVILGNTAQGPPSGFVRNLLAIITAYFAEEKLGFLSRRHDKWLEKQFPVHKHGCL
ncbi:hypothetical protein [Ruminococcus sp.]|uniref:hypothetical protein n=1 Tax=Ruminococcus sp. TaxID=41978 RepID=UPI0025D4BBB8|nr:hypothetical protein [Ruminococcus sp.]